MYGMVQMPKISQKTTNSNAVAGLPSPGEGYKWQLPRVNLMCGVPTNIREVSGVVMPYITNHRVQL